jgi:murein DD-endopeptidase MepM/ murein hydrolase activator NlpD
MRRHPRLIREIVTALCVVAMLTPAVGALAADPDPEAKLGAVREQIGQVQESLEGIERQRVVTLDDLEVIDGELAILDGRLAELGAELAGAERGVAAVEQRLAVTTSQLTQTEARLSDTRQRLAREREVFAERTRASFMYGGPSIASALIEAESVADLARSVQYVQRVMEHDRDRVNLVGGLVREVDAVTVDLGVLQDRQAADRALAAAERDRVADLVAEEEEVRAVADAERHKRQLVLTQLDADRDTHLMLVASLERESQAIEDELRRLAEEQARAAEEARVAAAAAAQADEQRRLTAADQQRADRSAVPAPAAQTPSDASVPAAPAGTGRMQRPADGPVTSGYGMRTHPIFGTQRMHTGIDFGPGQGAPIFAAESGTVISASARGGYGNTIILDHGSGLTTLYAHQSRFAVGGGERVSRGQVIGYVGSTGNSTGPHLHFEVRQNGAHRNPNGYL